MNDNIPDPGPVKGPQKAVTGGTVSAFAVLFAYAVARLTGAIEIPDIGLVTEAIYAVGTAIGAGLLTGWRTYMKPNRDEADIEPLSSDTPYLSIAAPLVLAVALAAPLGGCASALFGAAEDPAAEGFRLAGAYAYAAIPAASYAALETADAAVLERVCRLDGTAFAAVSGARAALEAGGGTLDAALAAAASALADLRLEVFGVSADLSDGDEIAERTVILSSVAIVSAIEMRAWRRDYMQPKLADMVANGRRPTPDEWAAVTDRAGALHEAIQARC